MAVLESNAEKREQELKDALNSTTNNMSLDSSIVSGIYIAFN